jgi:hypothetical protein
MPSPLLAPDHRQRLGRMSVLATALSLCLAPSACKSKKAAEPAAPAASAPTAPAAPAGPGTPAGPAARTELPLRPAAEAYANLAAEMVIANLERTLQTIDALAKKLTLPVSGDEVRSKFLPWGRLPPLILEKVDLTKPVGIALMVRPGGKGDAPPVAALALKEGPGAFDALVAAVGTVSAHERDAVQVAPTDNVRSERVWMLPLAGTVCVATSVELLIEGCNIAFAARRDPKGDVRVTARPDGVARIFGTTVNDAIAQSRQKLEREEAQMLANLGAAEMQLRPAVAQLLQEVPNFVFQWAADTTLVRASLSLDLQKGLEQTLEVVPRPGSSLATLLAPRRPYAVAPALLTGAQGGLSASGDRTVLPTLAAMVQSPLLDAAVPAGEKVQAVAAWNTILGALSGPSASRLALAQREKLSIQYDLVYGLRAGADGKAVLAAIEQLARAPWLASVLNNALGKVTKFRIGTQREGEVLVTRVALDLQNVPPRSRAELASFPHLDGTPIEVRFAVANERLLVVTGADGAARIGALAHAPTGGPAGNLGLATEETKGADGFYYLDAGALLRPLVAALAQSPLAGPKGGRQEQTLRKAIGLLTSAQLTAWASYRGGESLTVTGRIPMNTLVSTSVVANGMTDSSRGVRGTRSTRGAHASR